MTFIPIRGRHDLGYTKFNGLPIPKVATCDGPTQSIWWSETRRSAAICTGTTRYDSAFDLQNVSSAARGSL